MSLRLVNLGLPKAGTTTLARALREAGLRVADWELEGEAVGARLYRGWFGQGDPLAHLPGIEALTQIDVMMPGGPSLWPQTDWGLIEGLRARAPDVRFVFSARDPAAQADSMLAWNTFGTKRLPRNAVPGLPAGFGGERSEIIRWIEGHGAFLRRVFAGDPAFLEYDVADPRAPMLIGAHLGLALPWWGRINTRRPAPGG